MERASMIVLLCLLSGLLMAGAAAVVEMFR